jgi:hypothetical protein
MAESTLESRIIGNLLPLAALRNKRRESKGVLAK